jgi:hypothetical protein
MVALAVLIATVLVAGIYAGQHAQVVPTATGLSDTAIRARADVLPDPDVGGPGPTNPNGPVY